MSTEQAVPVIPSEALVVNAVDESTLVIDRGRRDGVRVGQRFLIYSLSPDEVHHPITGASLGHLEIVKGIGIVSQVEDKMATISSLPKVVWRGLEPVEVAEPFNASKVGDKARPI
jgi:hypothetical protein